MICVGIDVAKDKHDCFILSSEGEVLADVFTISNNAEGFDPHPVKRTTKKYKDFTRHRKYAVLCNRRFG